MLLFSHQPYEAQYTVMIFYSFSSGTHTSSGAINNIYNILSVSSIVMWFQHSYASGKYTVRVQYSINKIIFFLSFFFLLLGCSFLLLQLWMQHNTIHKVTITTSSYLFLIHFTYSILSQHY